MTYSIITFSTTTSSIPGVLAPTSTVVHSGLTLEQADSIFRKNYHYTPRFRGDFTHWIEAER